MAAAPVQPPVIHETFTPLPCPMHPGTTIEIEGCYEQDILKTDRQINAAAKAIFFKLRADARAGFVQSEKAWLVYRRAGCAAEASKYAGGTLSGVVDAACTANRNKTHVRDLSDLLKTLSTP